MGYYINPPTETKEAFIHRYGTRLEELPQSHTDGESVVVCLVHNTMFTAAAIAYSPQELQVFSQTDPRDKRPKEWWTIPIKYLIPPVVPVPIATVIK